MDKKQKKRIDPAELQELYAKAKITFEHDGNFTIAIAKYGKELAVGVAKKSPGDPLVPERGEQIALIRALKKLHKRL